MKLQTNAAKRLKITASKTPVSAAEGKEFTFKPGAHWKFGSWVVPGRITEHTISPPLPLDGYAFSVLKPTAYNAKPLKGHFMVEVQHLCTWQNHVDPGKLRPLPANVHSLEPIEVRQVAGKLVIWNGNHRAASAFVQGVKAIPATITNYDDPKNFKYRKDGKTAVEYPLSSAAKAI